MGLVDSCSRKGKNCKRILATRETEEKKTGQKSTKDEIRMKTG
jgi:hypothetical protein